MSMFPVLELEAKVQVNEKTRLSAVKSFKTPDEAAISLVRIKPLASGSFITVTSSPTDSSTWFLDWQYSAAATETVTVEFTVGTGPGTITTGTATIQVVTSATEKLFSTDKDLMAEEPDILKFVRDGKSSFNDIHRVAQEKILDDIYRQGILSDDDDKLTVAEVVDTAELKQWSKYMALRIIFESVSNKPDDIFAEKALKYEKMEFSAREKAINQMQLDLDQDGTLEDAERVSYRSASLVRR